MDRFDVVVVGVGGMGSAALYHLARRGKRVLGLERFDLLHETCHHQRVRHVRHDHRNGAAGLQMEGG